MLSTSQVGMLLNVVYVDLTSRPCSIMSKFNTNQNYVMLALCTWKIL